MYICGNDLRIMRQKAGLTTVQMAKLAGVRTRKTYENWEKNIGSPNMNQFIEMTLGCGIDVGTLVSMSVDRSDIDQHLEYDKAVM